VAAVAGGVWIASLFTDQRPEITRTDVAPAGDAIFGPSADERPQELAPPADGAAPPPPARAHDRRPFVRGVVVDPGHRPIAHASILARRGR